MSFYPKTLAQKLIVLLLLIATIPALLLGGWSYWSGKQALEKHFLSSFSGIVTSKAGTLRWYLKREITRIEDFSSDASIHAFVEQYSNPETSKTELTQKLTAHLIEKTTKIATDVSHGYYDTLVLDTKGQVLASNHPETANQHQFEPEFLARALKGAAIKDIYKNPTTGELGFAVAAPLYRSKTNIVIGMIINRISLKEMNAILLDDVAGLGTTGEIYLVNKDGYMISPSRFIKDTVLSQEVDTEPVQRFHSKKETISGYYLDYRKISVFGVSEAKVLSEFYGLDWLLIIEMNESEINESSNSLKLAIFLFGLAIVAASIVIGVMTGRLLSAPIKTSIQDFFTTSSELSVTTEQHERTAAHQAAAVNETSATMDELGRSAQQSIFQAESANSTAKQAVINAKTGARAMEDMLTSMEELSQRVGNIGAQILRLSEHTSQIGHVTEAVKDIANQTNLLALNAAVEATRAGEHGKGFTVVSQEIRKLAEQSKKSAERISDLVDTIQKGTNATVLATEAGTQTTKLSEEQVKYAKQSFDVLLDSVNNIAEVLQQIALTAKQQSNATNQVVEAMAMINTGAQETANGINQNKRAIQQLNTTARSLQNMV
jgi:methyl-accepting chemotaxis protein